MTEAEVLELVRRLPGVRVVTAGREGGTPEVAWGDSFSFCDPADVGEAARRLPFAALVTTDHGELDDAELDRVLPHPVHGSQGWACVLDPGLRTRSQLAPLLAEAHASAAEHHHRRGFGG